MKMAITDPRLLLTYSERVRLVEIISSALDHWSHALQNRFGTVAASSTSDAFGVKAFDDELAGFRAAVPAVCAQRNNFLSIFRLPSELLAIIFFIVSVNEPTNNHTIKLGWIRVFHVCSRWRQVALQAPMLWAHVVFDLGFEWAFASLERAKHAPLIIQYHTSTIHARPMPVDLVAPPQLSHTKTINLCGEYRVFSDAIQSLVYPALILEYIYLSIKSLQAIPHLPVDLFAHHAPNLRIASFDGLIIPWSSLALHGLTSLSVTLLHMPPSHRVSALPPRDELLEALSGMPFLECLSIIKTLPLPDSRSSHTIILPRLSRLELEGQWLSCMALLAGIQFPGTAQLHLTCVSRTNHDPPVDVLLSVLERQAKWLGDTSPLDCMPIQIGRSLRVIGWSRLYSPEQSVPSRLERALELNFSTLPTWTMVSIIRAIHIQDLVVLRLRMDAFSLWNLATLRDVFRHAHRLKHVHLANIAAPMFCALLDQNPGNATTQAHDQIALFPDLESIRLKYVEVDHIYTAVNVNEPLPAVRGSLRRGLNGRQNLQRIVIQQCYVSEEWVEDLKKFVPTVIWDGNKQ